MVAYNSIADLESVKEGFMTYFKKSGLFSELKTVFEEVAVDTILCSKPC